jgi:hypothetical protein
MAVSLLTTLLLPLSLGVTDPEKIICVPGADGRSWDCGKGENAPAPRSLPSTHQRAQPPAPPPFLMDPSRAPAVTGATSVRAPPPMPVSAPQGAVAPPISVAVPSPAAQAAAVKANPPQVATAPASAAEPDSTAAAAPTVATSLDETQPASPPAAKPASVAVATATQPAGPDRAVGGRPELSGGAEQLLALAGTGYTVQLAAARSSLGFDDLRRQLGIAAADTYSVSLRRNGETWSLLLWRSFPDLASARSAAAELRGSFWPRRLQPLQQEVRAAR